MAIVKTRRWPMWIPAILGVLVFMVIAVLAVGAKAFEAQSEREVQKLFGVAAKMRGETLTAMEVEDLPPPVRRWLEASGAVGREKARTVRLMQRGLMRTAIDAPWSEAAAVQYFSVPKPGFVWLVSLRMKGLPIAGRDHYLDGKGRMLITAAAVVRIIDAHDEAIAQGAMLRYLGEIIWFPSAAVAPYIAWEAIDDFSARATMTDGGRSAQAVFHFDEQNRVLSMEAERFYFRDTGSTKERWQVVCDQWSNVRGITMPTHGDARWKLREGELSYYRWEILDVEPNNPELYVPGDAPHPERAPLPSPIAVR
jgi:hypothetical protein